MGIAHLDAHQSGGYNKRRGRGASLRLVCHEQSLTGGWHNEANNKDATNVED